MTNIENLQGRVESHILKNISKDSIVENNIDPWKFIHFSRLDIVAKFLYAKYFLEGNVPSWIENVYRSHLFFWNGFRENDGSGKANYEDYKNTFEKTIVSISKGFDPSISIIPIGRTGVPLNGAHRIAASAATGNSISISKFNTVGVSQNPELMLENGMPTDQVDFLVKSLCEFKDDISIAVLFPICEKKENEILTILNNHGHVFYQKGIELERNGVFNLVLEMYKGASWADPSCGSSGVFTHTEKRYVPGKKVHFLFLHGKDRQEWIKAKSKIRNLFDEGNYPVHITDDEEDTLRLANILLNPNGVHHLNNSHYKNNLQFLSQFKEVVNFFNKNSFLSDRCCVVGSSVLSAYGIRDSRDIDVITTLSNKNLNGFLDVHDDFPCVIDKEKSDILYDPENYFFYNGIKFLSLRNLFKYKKNRSEVKDIEDLKLMNGVLDVGSNKNVWSELKYNLRVLPKKVAIHVSYIIPKPLYPFAFSLYKAVKRLVLSYKIFNEVIGPNEVCTKYKGVNVYYEKGIFLPFLTAIKKTYKRDEGNTVGKLLSRYQLSKIVSIGDDSFVFLMGIEKYLESFSAVTIWETSRGRQLGKKSLSLASYPVKSEDEINKEVLYKHIANDALWRVNISRSNILALIDILNLKKCDRPAYILVSLNSLSFLNSWYIKRLEENGFTYRSELSKRSFFVFS